MRSKILFCFSCLFSLAAASQNDYLTGTWKGTMAIGYDAPIFTIDFTIQLKQEGRFVWGLYTFGNNPNFDSCNCVGKLTTKLNRKNNWLINLYQDGIVSNTISLDSCASFNYFQSSYSKKGNIEMLGGK